MEKPQPQRISTSEFAAKNETCTTPFSQQTVLLSKQAHIELKWQANYWQAQFERLQGREAALKAEVEAHLAPIRDLKQRLYGTKSEKSSGRDQTGESKPASTRKRGQQPGRKGHGRSDRSTLPVVAEVRDLSEEAKHCPACGEAFLPFPGTDVSDLIEVEVQAHLRRIERKRSQQGCGCPQVPGIITAPPAPRLIPKSPLGVSGWCQMLLDKYLYGRPTHRLCQELSSRGLPLSQGTVPDGLHKIAALFEPLRPILREHQMGEKLFHGDETRWEVSEEIAGKAGHRWYVWVMQSASVVYSRMAPGRGANVPKTHFDGLHRDVVEVVLVCDRFSASKSFAKSANEVILAFCWAHVRRDCIGAARSWPALTSWMFVWVEEIRELSRLNTARLEVWDKTLPLDRQSAAFAQSHGDLEAKLSEMPARCDAHLQAPDLHLAKKKVLSSLPHHWNGLTVFLARPEVAMDNNAAERARRGPVVGRKNSYGSGRVWSAHLAAMMFRVLHTVLLWGLNPHHWLRAYLQACADHGGQSPTDLSSFLPWERTPERREELARPLCMVPSPLPSGSRRPGDPEVTDTS